MLRQISHRSCWIISTFLGIAATFALVAPGQLPAQTRPEVLSIGIERPSSALYIGNSFFYYNKGINTHVGQLLAAADPEFKFTQTLVGIGGSGLDWHDVESYFRPNALRRYTIDANNNLTFNKAGERLFDVAIMVDCSQCPIHPQLKDVFWEYAKKHSKTVRKHGAIPVFFMTWAYADKPEMTVQLAEQYTKAGNENHALVIPAGLAFARSVKQRPALNLYESDLRHPNLMGTYLAACTVYASIFRHSPVGLKYDAGLDAETAKFLQTVAWETVQDYFRS